MPHARFLIASFVVALIVASAAPGAPINPQAVAINQISFRNGPDSVVGEITIDCGLAGDPGFVNVARDVQDPVESDWLVKNLPVLPQPYNHPTITTRLDLTAFVGADGVPIHGGPPIDLIIDYQPNPSATLGDVLAELTPGLQWQVGTKCNAVGGVGLFSVFGYEVPPALIGLTFDLLGIPLNDFIFQTGHPNVQTAECQCAPAAMANSFQWLENTTPIVIPEPHVLGFGKPPDGSLVGTLDIKTGRGLGANRHDTASTGVWPMDGKLAYIAMTGDLKNQICVKHRVGGRANNTGTVLDGNTDYTHMGVTSTGKGGDFDIDWIITELMNGEDVEFDLHYQGPNNGRHYVEAVGAGYILGVPFLLHKSDKCQADKDLLDVKGTDDIDFEWIDNATGLARNSNAIIDQVISQSYRPCYTVAVTNNTGRAVDDFHLELSAGTCCPVAGAMLLENAPGAGTALISSDGDTIWIEWGSPRLPAGGSFELKFAAPPGATIVRAEWTIKADPVRDAITTVPLGGGGGPPFCWKTTATNGTGIAVDDFHAEYLGTGGTIAKEMVTMNAPGAGVPAISSMLNMIWIDWGPPGLPAGETFMYEFDTDFSPVDLNSAEWTVLLGAGDATLSEGVHLVHDHVWSESEVVWGQGEWTKDGAVICVTHPGGVTTGGLQPMHKSDWKTCPDWPNDWHWDVDVPLPGVGVWRGEFWFAWTGEFDLGVELFCHPSFLDITIMVDVDQDSISITDSVTGAAIFDGQWSGYPGNLPAGWEPTGEKRMNFPPPVDPPPDPDQVHIVGPIPSFINTVGSSEFFSIEASVQNNSVGLPGEEVVFSKVEGESLVGGFSFELGSVSPDGTSSSVSTDADGVATMAILAAESEPALIKVSVPGTALQAFFFFSITSNLQGVVLKDLPLEQLEEIGGIDPEDLGIRLPAEQEFRIVELDWTDDDRVSIAWASTPGVSYTVQYSQDLVTWSELASDVASGGTTTSYQDDSATSHTRSRYYRVVKMEP